MFWCVGGKLLRETEFNVGYFLGYFIQLGVDFVLCLFRSGYDLCQLVVEVAEAAERAKIQAYTEVHSHLMS